VEDHILSVHPPFHQLALKPIKPPGAEEILSTDTPLSPTEEEMFHTLCGIPDWEAQPCKTAEAPVTVPVEESKPLRRSKRAAAHAATVAVRGATATRSSKRTAAAAKSAR
jgi:hypothetical protein